MEIHNERKLYTHDIHREEWAEEMHNERKLHTHDIHREVWAEETHNERKLYTRHTQGGMGRGDAQ